MYQDLEQKYWWYGLKRDVAAHVAMCDVCQRVKAEHQRPAGLLHPNGSGKRLVWTSLSGCLAPRKDMIPYG
jgi:ABC-type branched-subunit amino acid transport system ATPase component